VCVCALQDGVHRGLRRNQTTPKVRIHPFSARCNSAYIHFAVPVVLQKHFAEHSTRGAVRHDDLRADERVVPDRAVGRGNDFGARRSSCERYIHTRVIRPRVRST